jgi:hypothetical protein
LHCHQLELAVSSEFQDLTLIGEDRIFAFPVHPGDVAIATWWLWEVSPNTQVNLETCPHNDF